MLLIGQKTVCEHLPSTLSKTALSQKKALTCSNVIYEQIESVSMVALFVNIIKTGREQVIADNFVKEKTLKFYVRYVDDALLLGRCQNIDKALQAFNGFDNNLKFTDDKFKTKHPIS